MPITRKNGQVKKMKKLLPENYPERHDRNVTQVEKRSGVADKGVREPSDGLVNCDVQFLMTTVS